LWLLNGDYKKMFLLVQTYLGGQSYCPPPHLTPQIQCGSSTVVVLDLDAKTVDGTIRTDTNLALELLGSKGQIDRFASFWVLFNLCKSKQNIR
jgi:hypothetical protein